MQRARGYRGQRNLTSRAVIAGALLLGMTTGLVLVVASPAGAAGPPIGSVLAWGTDAAGDLGNGSTTESNVPVTASLPAHTSAVALGAHHFASYAITSTGSLLAWGSGTDGDLGDNSTANSEVPVPVQLPAGTVVTSVAAGHDFALAVTSTGQVYAWGNNSDGQLGNNSTTQSDVPVAVQMPSRTYVTAVAAGHDSSYALTATGSIYAWGNNSDGQLGNNSTTQSDVPAFVQLYYPNVAKAIAAGSDHVLALTASGQVYAWGYNNDGQLGNGGTTESNVPTAVSLPTGVTATAVAAGHYHSLALTSAGGIYAWGNNSDGQLGNNSTTQSDVPVAVQLPAGVTATAVAGGSRHSLALTASGKIYSWGSNSAGQLGDNSTTPSAVPIPVQLPTGVTATAIAGGNYYSMALLAAPSASVSPGAGVPAGGTPVTISGANFSAVSAVDFGGEPASSFQLVSSTEITAVSPPHPEGAVAVTVTTPNGISPPSAADQFTYASTVPTEPPLPPKAGSGASASLAAISCTSATSCVAVGSYSVPVISPLAVARSNYGLIETLSGGKWSATQAPEPANAGTSANHEQNAFLDAVSCPSAGNCIAVGYYEDNNGSDAGLIETLSGGTWTATEAPEPANAGSDADGHQGAQLNALSCTAAGTCTTVGAYADTNGYQYGLIDTLSAGTWTATEAPEPANAGTDGAGQGAFLEAVSCVGTTCAAVGFYDDTSNYEYGLIDTLSAGTWTATEAPEPPNAGTDAGSTQRVQLTAASCSQAGSCTSVGSYEDTNRYQYGLIETLSAGSWRVTTAPEPANAGTDAGGNQFASLAFLSCTSGATCSAAGSYNDATGVSHDLIDALSGGKWSAVEGPEPPNAGTGAGPAEARINKEAKRHAGLPLWCAAGGSCTYVASYSDTSEYSYGLIDTLSRGTWSAAEAPEPMNTGTDADAYQGAGLVAVTCTAGGTCYSVGSYQDLKGNSQGLIEVSAIAPISAASLSPACGQLTLHWTNPDTPTYAGVYIERSTTGPPSTDNSGTRVANVSAPGTTYTDKNLVSGQSYYYGLFAHDASGRVVASGAEASAKPVCQASATATVVHDTATRTPWSGKEVAGASAYDTATIRGSGGVNPTGALTYSVFYNGACSGKAKRTDAVILTGGAAPASAATGPLATGHYSFEAFYGGDTRYGATHGACESFSVAAPEESGYYLEGGDGGVFAFHRAFFGSVPPPKPPGLGLHVYDIVAMATVSGGYYVAGRDGAVFAFGAHFFGSLPGIGIHVADIVSIAATPDGGGYWLVGSNGEVYPFGDAPYRGSCSWAGSGCEGVTDIVAIARPDAGGYWLVGKDGSVYSFGDAKDYGSCIQSGSDCAGRGDIVAITADGIGGYWLAGADGGVFGFGAAIYHGSCPQSGSSCNGVRDVVGIASPDASGYWLAEANGNVLAFGDAKFFGRCGNSGSGCVPLARPIVAIGS